MSSTYVHYSSSSSLPSDYALLSQYAASHGLNPVEASGGVETIPSDTEDDDDRDDRDDDNANGVDIRGDGHIPVPRRQSLPTGYLTPFNPIMGPLPDRHGHRSGPTPKEPNENTPLLAPPVPRIEEECDAEDAAEPSSLRKMYREEFAILTKYTLPVFGCV